jgi:Amt family ammonium transporter
MICAGAASLAAASDCSIAAESTPPTPNVLTKNEINSGDTAWMLISCGLVILMVPGLALFYGGMVRRKNVLGTMMHSMVPLAIIGVMWVLFGYALAFGDSWNGWIGWNFRLLGLHDIIYQNGENRWMHHSFGSTSIPVIIHCTYQGMFAIITPALISGAFAERIRFGPYCLFILLWGMLVYCPLAHWVWAVDSAGNPAGWLGKMGALDYAGGTVVHIAAGVSGLAAILVLPQRVGYPEHAMHPNSMVLTLLGAGLLWFGWFGFNGGSALNAGALATSAFGATHFAAATAAMTWAGMEWILKGKPSALGTASGMVAGLATVTQGSGFVSIPSAMLIGIAAGGICFTACWKLKTMVGYDDSLDAFGVHGVGGMLGALLTGVLASAVVNPAIADTYHVGEKVVSLAGPGQFWNQAQGAGFGVALAVCATYLILKVVDATIGLRVTADQEIEGLDTTQHGEEAYNAA